MKSRRMMDWLKKIYATEAEEISCDECFHWVSHYVEVELAGEDAAASMPKVKQHLGQCSACREEYETLVELQRMDNEGGAPSTDELTNLLG